MAKQYIIAADNISDKTIFIYSLCNPETKDVRYIGKTNNPQRRLERHITDKRTKHKYNWIQSLKRIGLIPEQEIIDEIPLEEWRFWERHYISLYKSWGFNLLNIDFGGDGVDSFSLEHRRKISIAHIGKKLSEEHKRKIGIKSKGRKQSKESIEKRAQKSRGIKRTPEQIRTLSLAHIGNKLSPESQAKRVEKIRGQKRTPEQINNMIEGRKANGGWCPNNVAKENMSKARNGMPIWNRGLKGLIPYSEEWNQKVGENKILLNQWIKNKKNGISI